jgi:hypothetical protein
MQLHLLLNQYNLINIAFKVNFQKSSVVSKKIQSYFTREAFITNLNTQSL